MEKKGTGKRESPQNRNYKDSGSSRKKPRKPNCE